MNCAYCGHAKKWHHGFRNIESDNTECLHPMGDEDECACSSFMTTKEYQEIYGERGQGEGQGETRGE